MYSNTDQPTPHAIYSSISYFLWLDGCESVCVEYSCHKAPKRLTAWGVSGTIHCIVSLMGLVKHLERIIFHYRSVSFESNDCYLHSIYFFFFRYYFVAIHPISYDNIVHVKCIVPVSNCYLQILSVPILKPHYL